MAVILLAVGIGGLSFAKHNAFTQSIDTFSKIILVGFMIFPPPGDIPNQAYLGWSSWLDVSARGN